MDWPILMIICGTMSLGIALEQTGTAGWIASHSVEFLQRNFSGQNLPWLMLVFFRVVTSIFTEFAGNNGAGGYDFRDFLRMGTPLNLICWAMQIVLIPMIWKF